MLVAEVETRRRLVHHEEVRLLRKRPGDDHELPLSSGELRIRTVREMLDGKTAQRAQCDRLVLLGDHREPVDVRRAAHQDDVGDGEGKRRRVCLRDVRDPAGQLALAHPEHAVTVHRDAARERLRKTEDVLENRRLAAAVRPEHADELAALHREGRAVDDLVLVVPGAKIVDLKHHFHPRML